MNKRVLSLKPKTENEAAPVENRPLLRIGAIPRIAVVTDGEAQQVQPSYSPSEEDESIFPPVISTIKKTPAAPDPERTKESMKKRSDPSFFLDEEEPAPTPAPVVHQPDNNTDSSKKPAIKLKLVKNAKPPKPTVQARITPSVVASATGWWKFFLQVDREATAQAYYFSPLFLEGLAPLGEASCGIFFNKMIYLFDQWGRDMQETVLCKSVSHTAVPSITPWQAAVRVVRLMAYHLLDDRWSFREGCATALREVLGESDSASLTVGEATHKGTVSLELGETTAVVPNTLRMVLLLSVLDLAWAEKELSGPFRYPVSEWEAPTYYRKIKDPVTLFSLYLEVCKGITPTALARVARRKKGKEQLEDVFMDYTELRERLMLMIGNCSQYNGPNSDITGIGNKLLELCLKAIRDAQFAEDGGEAYLEIQRARRVAEDGLGDHLLPTHRLFQLEELGALFPPVHVVATIQVSLPVAAEETATAAETDTGRKKRGKAGKSTSHKPEKVLKEKTVKSERTTEKPKRGRPPAPPEETVTEGFNLRCDRCGVYRRLPHPLNPPPVYWDCSYMGATCDEKNAANYIRMREKLFLDKDEDLPLTRRVKPAAKRARKRSPQKRRRPTPSNSSSSSSASSSTSSTDSSSASSSSSAPSAPRQDHRVELAKLTNEMNKLEQEPLTFKPFQQLQQLRQMQKHIVKLKK